MEEKREQDFFQQALKAFDAPIPREEAPEAPAPIEQAQVPEEKPANKRRRWPAVLASCAAFLVLAVVLFWAFGKDLLPPEPTEDIASNSEPTGKREYTLSVSIYRNPGAAFAVEVPEAVTVELSLSQAEWEALLADFEALVWLDYSQSAPTGSSSIFDDAFDGAFISSVIKLSIPFGKVKLLADGEEQLNATFTATGIFVSQGGRARDVELLYAILAHLSVVKEDAPQAEYVCDTVGGNAKHYINFDADGASMYHKSNFASGTSAPYDVVQLSYTKIGDILLMWPSEGERELFGFIETEGGTLTYSLQHSHTTVSKIAGRYDKVQQSDSPDITVPELKGYYSVRFCIPMLDSETQWVQLTQGQLETLNNLLQSQEWMNKMAISFSPKTVLEIQLVETATDSEPKIIALCGGGYLDYGIARAVLNDPNWISLLNWASGVTGTQNYNLRYLGKSKDGDETCQLDLYSGSFSMSSNPMYPCIGRYAVFGDVLYLDAMEDGVYYFRKVDHYSWQFAGSWAGKITLPEGMVFEACAIADTPA